MQGKEKSCLYQVIYADIAIITKGGKMEDSKYTKKVKQLKRLLIDIDDMLEKKENEYPENNPNWTLNDMRVSIASVIDNVCKF